MSEHRRNPRPSGRGGRQAWSPDLEAIDAELAANAAEIERLRSERDAAVADRGKLRQHAENLGNVALPMLAKREADLAAKDAEIERLKAALHRADANAALREAVREDVETDMETLTAERDEAEGRADRAEAERDRLRLAWASARRGRRTARWQVRALEKAFDRQKADAETALAAFSRTRAELAWRSKPPAALDQPEETP